MRLSFNPSKPVPFHELDPMPFQELCRDLFEREEGVSTCEVFGINGQFQRGIDLKAQRKGAYAYEVGQCKCYEEFSPREIRKASEEFLKHLDYWKEKNVKRFILFVACAMDTTQRLEEIDRQIKAFHELGIEYEVWSARTLRTKLKDHPDIVWRYTRNREWVESICGVAATLNTGGNVGVERGSALVGDVNSARLTVYAEEHSRVIDRRLNEIRDLYRKGRKKSALQQLDEIQGGASWEIIEASLKGRLLRQKAAYLLDLNGDIAGARSLADEAARLDPQGNEITIRSLLAYYAEGPEAALQIANPADSINSYNLRLALLIETERIAEAIDLLRSVPGAVQPDNETKRLKALALLLGGDIDGARAEIEQALGAEPEWEGLRFTSAVINYFSCLSPASLPKRLVPWPEPPNWFVLKRDAASLERLKHAESEFAALARNTEKDGRRLDLETWHLACVANDPYRQEEASSLCIELLNRDPRHYRALIWAIARGYEPDYPSCERALRNFVEEDAGTHPVHKVEGLGVLLTLYLKENAVSQADELLTKHENLFLEIEARQNLDFWRGQILIAGGLSQEAESVARKERNPEARRRLLLPALRAQAERRGDWREFLRYLEKTFNRTGQAEFLFELCSIKAEQGKWDFVAERAETLIEMSQTAAALRLAAVALWKVKKPGKCLNMLDRGARFFRDNVLPGDLARLKIDCQIDRGDLPQAVAEGKELLKREQTTANVLALMEAQLRQADLKELAVTARNLLRPNLTTTEGVDPQNLIRAADLVSFGDKELARDLWRAAARSLDNRPELLAELITTGYALGLDQEIRPYFAQMAAHSQKGDGPLRAVSLKELMAHHQKQVKKVKEAQRDYDSGARPLHMLAPEVNLTAVEVLHGLPDRHRKEFGPLRQLRVYVRHGGRPLFSGVIESSENWRLHLDISALILAEDLGILDDVEAAFKPIFIAAGTTEALVAQRRNLRHHQPSQVEECEAVLRLLVENKLRRLQVGMDKEVSKRGALAGLAKRKGGDWTAALIQAHSEQGFLVDHFPLTGNDLSGKKVVVPEPYQTLVIGCRVVLDNLKAHGWITEEEYRQAQDALGAENRPLAGAPSLPAGSKLYLMGGTTGLLANAGVLNIACRNYRIFVEGSYIDRARNIVEATEHAGQLDEWLENLSRRINNGLASGAYQYAQLPDERPAAKEATPDMDVLYNLMLSANRPGDVLWIDDRWCNSYLRIDSSQIIGVNEVLEALRQRGFIGEQGYYEKLLRLRAGNLRYVPVSADEILYHLNNASVEGGALVETAELRILRKYVAGCLLDVAALQIPPLPPDSPNRAGEMAFVFNTKGAVESAIAGVWKNGAPSVKETEARADWLLNNLYTGSFGARHLLPYFKEESDATHLLGLDIAGLFTIGCLSIIDLEEEKETSERLRQFTDWFEDRLLLPRLIADPEASEVAGATVSTFITDASRDRHLSHDDADALVARLANSLIYTHLPEDLKAKIRLAQDVMEWIGIGAADCVTIEHVSFDQAEFSHAVGDVMGGAPGAGIKALEPKAEYTFKRLTDENGIPVVGVFTREDESTPLWRVKDEILTMAAQDGVEREAALKTHRHWFDCEREKFEQAVREISGIEDVTSRMSKVQDWRNGSAEVYYRNLAYKLGRRGDFQWAELIPASAEGLLRHYRLPANTGVDGDFTAVWERSAAALLDEEGLETALDRLARLPVIIPDAVVEELGRLPENDRNGIIQRCAARWGSPVGKLHLADIALRASAQDGVPQEASSAIEGLFDEGGKAEFKLFRELLELSYEKFALWKAAEAWAPSLKLAMVWAHAVRLYDIFRSGVIAPGRLTRVFAGYNRARGLTTAMRRRADLWSDALHPRRFSRAVFLTHGVATVLAGRGEQCHDTLKLRDRILSLSSVNEENPNLVFLLCDYTQGSNSANSYLGGDHEAVARIIGIEAADHLSPARLRDVVAEAVRNLEEDANGRDWITIEAVSRELPLRPEVSLQLNGLIEKIDFSALFEQHPQRALSALRVAINQSYYANDDKLRGRLENELLNCLKSAFSAHDEKNAHRAEAGELPQDEQVVWLIDLAFRLALRADDPRSTSANFSRLLRLFIDACPSVSAYLVHGIPQLLRQLPASYLHGMWTFWLAVRAS
jgi:hypothetical protein